MANSIIRQVLFLLLLLLTITRSGRLAEIRWSFCIWKSQRILCVSFSGIGSRFCIYRLYVWSNFCSKYNSLWITLSTQSCVVLYSFSANLLHLVTIWLIVSSLSPHNLHLLVIIIIIIIFVLIALTEVRFLVLLIHWILFFISCRRISSFSFFVFLRSAWHQVLRPDQTQKRSVHCSTVPAFWTGCQLSWLQWIRFQAERTAEHLILRCRLDFASIRQFGLKGTRQIYPGSTGIKFGKEFVAVIWWLHEFWVVFFFFFHFLSIYLSIRSFPFLSFPSAAFFRIEYVPTSLSTLVCSHLVVIYEGLYFDLAQGQMNGAPNETRTHSCRFASLTC